MVPGSADDLKGLFQPKRFCNPTRADSTETGDTRCGSKRAPALAATSALPLLQLSTEASDTSCFPHTASKLSCQQIQRLQPSLLNPAQITTAQMPEPIIKRKLPRKQPRCASATHFLQPSPGLQQVFPQKQGAGWHLGQPCIRAWCKNFPCGCEKERL